MNKIFALLFLFTIASPAYAIETLILAAAAAGAEAVFVNFVINFALSQIVSRIFGKKPPQVQDNGVRQQIPPNSVNSIPIVYGDAYLGGVFVDAVLSENQNVMFYVFAISSISPNGQFTFDKTKFYYGDRLVTFDTTEPAKVISLTDGSGNVDTKIADNLYIYLYRSNAAGVITNLDTGGSAPGSGSPDTIMSIVNGVPAGLEWPASGRQMYGTAFAIVKLIYSRDDETTQLQPITFYAKHYLNGTGVAKPGDVWQDYMTSTLYGGSIDLSLINTTSATALNNYADGLISYTNNEGNPATQPRYRVNGVLDTGQNVLENVERILNSCDSWMAYDAPTGQWSIVVNKPEATSLAFNDDNIIGDIRVNTIDINQSVNQVEARFPNKLNKDIPDFIFIKTPVGLMYPNEPVNKYTTTFDLVNDSVQAQYLANRILEQAREDLIVTFTSTYYGIQANAGDVVSLTNSAYGWNAKLFRVMKVNEQSLADGNLGAKLELSEYNVQVYDDKPITEFSPAPNSDLPSPSYFSNLTTPTVIASRPSAGLPSFDVRVTIPATGRVTFLNLFYTTTPTPATSDWRLLDVAFASNGQAFSNSTNYDFLNQVLPAGTYYFGYLVGNELAQTAISLPGASFSWTPIAPTGPTGATGSSGPTGPTGTTGGNGVRTADGFVYYTIASATAPAGPTLSGFNFTTGTFSSISANWTTTFTAPAPSTNPSTQAGSKFWAVRYYVTEATFGGTQTVTITSPFNWQNFDGLVTFTNVTTNSGTTFIDGGNIKAATITVDKLTAGLLIGYSLRTGVGHTPNGYAFEVASSGLVQADNIFGGLIVGDNSYYTASSVTGYGSNSGSGSPNEAVRGVVIVGNSSTTAHGVRGQNIYWGTSGLVGPANGYDFYADGSGTNYGPFTGTHDSLVNKNVNFVTGDIVIDTQIIIKNGVSSTLSLVQTSTTANQPGALGIVCAQPKSLTSAVPAAYIDGFDPETGVPIINPQYEVDCDLYNLMPVNAVGEGQINVCGEGGNIAVGDLIVTSSTPGKGMKQADNTMYSYTVAKARETATFSSSTDVKMIACIYLSG